MQLQSATLTVDRPQSPLTAPHATPRRLVVLALLAPRAVITRVRSTHLLSVARGDAVIGHRHREHGLGHALSGDERPRAAGRRGDEPVALVESVLTATIGEQVEFGPWRLEDGRARDHDHLRGRDHDRRRRGRGDDDRRRHDHDRRRDDDGRRRNGPPTLTPTLTFAPACARVTGRRAAVDSAMRPVAIILPRISRASCAGLIGLCPRPSSTTFDRRLIGVLSVTTVAGPVPPTDVRNFAEVGWARTEVAGLARVPACRDRARYCHSTERQCN